MSGPSLQDLVTLPTVDEAKRATAEQTHRPTATALTSCPACHRHPSTHLATGDDLCPLCGLGDVRE